MKCEICRKTIGETFLKKPIGAYLKDKAGKLHIVCFECQKQFRAKQEILKKIL